jgi:hypothetical protein
VTAGELFFLLFGISVGVVAGAVLLDVVRAHPSRPEVRVTVTHNALPLRVVRPETPGEPITLRRTMRGPGRVTTEPALDLMPDLRAAPRRPAARVPIPVSGGVDPLLTAVGGADLQPGRPLGRSHSEASGPVAVLERTPGAVAVAERPSGGVATAERSVAMAPANEPAREANAAAQAARSSASEVAADPCAGARQLAGERCAVAEQARTHAERAAGEARDARRAYDAAVQEAEAATHEADPRGIAAAKEAARRAFREATAGARDRHAQELAATVWLTEINRINRDRRASLARAATATKRMEQLLPRIEALTLAADAARITAETATAACNDARGALAICEEAGVDRRAADLIAIAPSRDRPPDDRPAEEQDDARIMVHAGGRQPAIYRLLQGDSDTMARVVDAAVHTPDERRQLQLDLSGLVDAIVAGAIEQAFLDFPSSHRFWAGLTRVESREVAVGLAGLGYRFDGLGGFDGGRVPSARDLSLAVGYAGLDPRRIRQWPTEAESRELYRDVTVAADEYLASMAPELSLSELVALLGRRSEALADLWNQWGHVRPLLMATAG